MRISILIIVSLIAGLALGVSHAFWRFGPSTDLADLASGRSRRVAGQEANGGSAGEAPVAVVANASFDFGKMEAEAKGEHEFTIRNEGLAPLQLQTGTATCKCTSFTLDKNVLLPGETATVSLKWEAKGGPGPFRQSGPIHTNDPKRPSIELVVQGEITTSVMLSPTEVVFASLPTNGTTSAQVKIYAYHAADLQILSHQFQNVGVADKFDVQAEPLPAEELQKAGAKSGVLLNITVKSGLPLGPLRQRIVLATNLERSPKLEIPVEGLVTSDISIVGSDWAANLGQLRLGKLSGQQGDSRTLRLVVRGPHHKEIEFKIIKVWPEQMRAELGAKSETKTGAISMVPITIRIPPGTPAMNHWGTDQGKFGEVLIETTHPEVKEVKLLVQFAVEG